MTAREPVRGPIRVPRWPPAAAGEPDFAAIRAEFEVPDDFPPAVLAEAERRAREPVLPELDATDIPLVTLDPVGSRDLDQAVHLAKREGGYRVSYAIADVGSFVRLGGALDAEARRRGQTLYSPDRRTPLHPPMLSEGAASLLADQLRPAVLWTIDLDADGEPVRVQLRRARVRSRAQLDYPSVQRRRRPTRARCPRRWPCCPRSAGSSNSGGPNAGRSNSARRSRRSSPPRTADGPWPCAATCRSKGGTPRSPC